MNIALLSHLFISADSISYAQNTISFSLLGKTLLLPQEQTQMLPLRKACLLGPCDIECFFLLLFFVTLCDTNLGNKKKTEKIGR